MVSFMNWPLYPLNMEIDDPRFNIFLRRRKNILPYSYGYLNEAEMFVCLLFCLFVACEFVCDGVWSCFGNLNFDLYFYHFLNIHTISFYTSYLFSLPPNDNVLISRRTSR